jgi:hypothetical protein
MFDRRALLSQLADMPVPNCRSNIRTGLDDETDKRVCTLMHRNTGGKELPRTLMDPDNATVCNERCLPFSPEDGNKFSFRNVAFSCI